jgi:hypothetical protein
MSAFKKIAGLVVGVSAVGVIGVAVAQGVPPNPHISNPALGAGSQTVTGTLIGETGELPWSDVVAQPTATLTRESEQAAVVTPAPQEPQQPVASASSSSSDTSTVAQAPADTTSNSTSSNTQSLGAGPSTDTSTTPQHAPRHDRG